MLQELIDELGQPTIKAIAAVLNVNPNRIYFIAKQSKDGEYYGPNEFNWANIEKFILRRLDEDQTLRDVVTEAHEWDVLFQKQDRRKSGMNKRVRFAETIEVDGKQVARRRYENFEMDSGEFIMLKDNPQIFEIVYQTRSHTVVRPVIKGIKGEYEGEEVKVLSNSFLNLKGIPPSKLSVSYESRV